MLNTEIAPGYLSYARGIGGHSPGWHRIAKIKGKFAEYSCVISVKRIWNRSAPEYQKIQFLSAHSARKFISLAAISDSHIWTKIRETYDETEDCSYMEIYQNARSENWWLIIIEDAIGAYEGSDWKAIPPELTQETLSGVTVLASLDLPANNPD